MSNRCQSGYLISLLRRLFIYSIGSFVLLAGLIVCYVTFESATMTQSWLTRLLAVFSLFEAVIAACFLIKLDELRNHIESFTESANKEG
jgi:hypothetical protein